MTVLGLGERAGNAPLEEIVVACAQTGQFETRVKLSELNHVFFHGIGTPLRG